MVDDVVKEVVIYWVYKVVFIVVVFDGEECFNVAL